MRPFIYGARNGIHIIDLDQTVPPLQRALQASSSRPSAAAAACSSSAPSARRRTSSPKRPSARRSTSSTPLARRHADQLEDHLQLDPAPAQARRAAADGAQQGYTKKERLDLTREKDKLERALGGIKDMGGTPDLIFVIDTNKEAYRDQGGAPAQHPGRRDRRYQLRSGRHHLSDPGQRRRGPRACAVLRPHRPCRARRHFAGSWRCRRRRRRSCRADRRGPPPEVPRPLPPRRRRRDLRAPVGAARRARRPRQADRCRAPAREEAQRRRHLALLAARRHDARRYRQGRYRAQAQWSYHARQLGRARQDARRRRLTGWSAASRGRDPRRLICAGPAFLRASGRSHGRPAGAIVPRPAARRKGNRDCRTSPPPW